MSKQNEPSPALGVAPRSAARLKLPPQWEKCKTGIKGVRKWRCLWTMCWVTECDDDDVFLHVGLRGRAIKIERRLNTVQQAIDKIHAASQKHREAVILGSSSNTAHEPQARKKTPDESSL